jgi:hypothetical protein
MVAAEALMRVRQWKEAGAAYAEAISHDAEGRRLKGEVIGKSVPPSEDTHRGPQYHCDTTVTQL